MNMIRDRIRRLAVSESAASIHGHWFSIQYRPNLIAGELLNVGVAFIDADTKSARVKVLEDLDRFGVMFGERLESEIRFALRSVAACLEKGRIEPPSENIHFSEPRFASGKSIEEILDQLFVSTVRLLSFARESASAPRVFASNEKVRRQVFDSIRLQAGLNAERILAESPLYVIKEGGREHTLDIPLRGAEHLGSVVSAAYASRSTLENCLLRASVDLETASRIFHQDKLGLFVLRPSADDPVLGGKKLIEIDNVIDLLAWKLNKQGFTVGVEDDVQRLAGEVLEWSRISR